MWSCEDGKSVPIACGGFDEPLAMPTCIAYPSATATPLVGAAALAAGGTAIPIVGVQRLLGRKYSTLSDAKWLAREAEDLIGCDLEPDGPDVRVKLSFARPKPSGLKKRGADAPSAKAASKSVTIDKFFAPEEMLYKLLLKARECAVEHTGGLDVTHVTISVPAHWPLSQRRAAHDCAMLAGLTPLAVISQPLALLCEGRVPLPRSADASELRLLIDWGGGGCSATLLQTAGGSTRIVESAGEECGGGLALDRLVVKALEAELGTRIAAAGVDLASEHSRVAMLRAAEKLKLQLFATAPGADGGVIDLKDFEAEAVASVGIELLEPSPFLSLPMPSESFRFRCLPIS